LIAPLAPPLAAVVPLELDPALFLVELQAARTPPASTAASAATATRRPVRIPVMVLPFGW
jgi:hypothetical protein